MKLKLNIPDNLSDITLEQYQKFMKVMENNKDNELFVRQKMVQIFCDVKLQDVDKFPHADFMEITEQLHKVLDQEPEHIRTFELKGVDYGFIPDFEDITLGEYVDMDKAFGDITKLHDMMSVMYRPITDRKADKYNIESYSAQVNPDFKDMPLEVVLGALVFFCNISSQLLDSILNSLKKELVQGETQEKLQSILTKNGVGMSQSMHSLTETIQGMKKSLLENFVHNYFISAI